MKPIERHLLPNLIRDDELPSSVLFLRYALRLTPWTRFANATIFLLRHLPSVGLSILHLVVSWFLIIHVGNLLGLFVFVAEICAYYWYVSLMIRETSTEPTARRTQPLRSEQEQLVTVLNVCVTVFGYPIRTFIILRFEILRLRSVLVNLRRDARHRFFMDVWETIGAWNVYVAALQKNREKKYPRDKKPVSSDWKLTERLLRELIRQTADHLAKHPSNVLCSTVSEEVKRLDSNLNVIVGDFESLIEEKQIR